MKKFIREWGWVLIPILIIVACITLAVFSILIRVDLEVFDILAVMLSSLLLIIAGMLIVCTVLLVYEAKRD